MSGLVPNHGEMNRRNAASSSPPPRTVLSPPVSPTVTHVSSRSPTPSPPDVHDAPRDTAPRPPSPPRSHSPAAHPSTMGSAPGGSHNVTENHGPDIPHRPVMPASASAPPGRLPRLLPYDTSQYADAFLPTAAVPTSSTSLAELAHLIRLQRYQEQRRAHSRVRLHRWLVSSALSARLVHCGELAHRTLIDNFRSDDKKSFAQLYNALHDVRNSCDATRRYALLEPDLEFGKFARAERLHSFSTFVHEIPPKIRDDLLHFISELRTNPDFLATRIISLSQQELQSLTAFRHALEPIESVMALAGRGKAVGNAQKAAPNTPSPVERLLSFQRHDPLSSLIYSIFANSAGPDSAEDMRRAEVWGTTCARLITEQRAGSEKFIQYVLDAWAGMREWPGKANLELYLMQALQDGQFLLERAEDQAARPRTAPETRSAKDTIAADEFYDKYVKRLFEVIDDEPSAGTIPEGIFEIGSVILRKLEHSKKHQIAARTFMVSRWFFSSFLLNSIIHPESRGIMTGHHITEHARQRILKELAIRAHKQVLDATYNWKQSIPILPEIRAHIDSIVSRFKNTRTNAKPVLLRAKEITSPRETVEVQPSIVLCPSDIITIVKTLFPDRRPASSHLDQDFTRNGGLQSAASSISGVSMPLRASSTTSGDASSILSISASSITSDATSREPLLDETDPSSIGSAQDEENKIAPTEEYGRRLRTACSEMAHVLGVEATSGSCHPCAEKWAVLYVSPDGRELRTRMRKDAEDEDEHDEDSPDSDSDEEFGTERTELESDYHQVKESIAKLVEEYEIPKELAPDSESKGFSNRTSTHRRNAKDNARTAAEQAASTEIMSKNPYHAATQASALAAHRVTPPGRHRSPQHPRSNSNPDVREVSHEKPSVLITMLEAAMLQCRNRSDFVNSHQYYKTLLQLRKLSSPSLTRNGYAPLLHYFSRGPRESLARCASAIEEFEAWFVWLKQSQERHDSTIEEMMLSLKALRDKTWYIIDVRNSAGYEEAKNVALALKIMGQPTKTPDGKPIPTHRPRQFSRPTNNFLVKTESQVLDLMMAPNEFGGPNKLADEQSDVTNKWLSQLAIENFCKGEERIHRFCLEIDRCVNKLVGDGILDGPVLWSSELYKRDKDALESGRQKGDLFLTGVGTLSIAGDEEYETLPGRSGSRGLDFAQRPSNGSLRSISQRNGSQQSLESGRWSQGRSNDLMDAQDYFGGSSPILTIDSTTTFWSPFQTQAHSPTSATSIRPRTASSSKGTVMLKQSAMVNDDKRRFLLDLKQTLTGLLLSDLGTMVFGHGSETDSWFAGDFGEECLQRKEEEDRRRKRALAKKKSMRSLKSARPEQRHGLLDTLGRDARGQPAAPVATLQHAAPEQHSASEHSNSSSDATARSTGLSAAKKAGLLEFPYNVAFRRLLKRFATHPNPFSKLHALYELELLIEASLQTRSGRHFNRRDTLPTVPQSPTLGAVPELSSREPMTHTTRAQNLEEAIANCEERRQHSLNVVDHADGSASPLPPRTSGTRSPVGPASTDTIVEVLQGLFRDAEVRPKTLFRDLQYIASFVPASMLDRTARGKAFWDAGLAALGLKQDVCRVMVEIADDIVATNTQNRSAATQHSSTPSTGAAGSQQQTGASTTPSAAAPVAASGTDEPPSRFTMSDAARMLIITAKEGDAVAERELAIFYLTHPDLLPRTVLPLTKPKDVFKNELLQKENNKRGKEDPGRSDPLTMCVAQHWMEMSKRGGDQLAIKYLRARDEMERIP